MTETYNQKELIDLDKYDFIEGSVIGKDCEFIKNGKILSFESWDGEKIISTGKYGARVVDGGTIVGNSVKLYEDSKIGSKSLILGVGGITGQVGDGCIVYNGNIKENSIIRDGVTFIDSYLAGDGGSSAIGKDSYVKYSKVGSKCAVGNRARIEGAIVSAFNMVCDDSEIMGIGSCDRYSATKDNALFREGSKVNIRDGYEYEDINSALCGEIGGKKINGFYTLNQIIEQMRNQDISLTSESLSINKDIKMIKSV